METKTKNLIGIGILAIISIVTVVFVLYHGFFKNGVLPAMALFVLVLLLLILFPLIPLLKKRQTPISKEKQAKSQLAVGIAFIVFAIVWLISLFISAGGSHIFYSLMAICYGMLGIFYIFQYLKYKKQKKDENTK
ncbi:MAG: hypothetical protein CVT88_05145 [Candidatus Altiarchaeales archaeon HGW-Altiarchaeales-1]|nr:MAG: hypothetical protein CVT88_05145 [Candidatus Altiarchaeales archaeon HGW-Altiarchaeales-1]